MKKTNIDLNDSIWTITEKFPETIPVFVSNGFPQMADPDKRRVLGAKISLKTALTLKQINPETFIERLDEIIRRRRGDQPENPSGGTNGKIRVSGLLPCPVRLPLLEAFTAFSKDYQASSGIRIEHELQAASMGTSWIETHLRHARTPEDLPDLFISAGFDLFFDDALLGKFKSDGVFEDIVKFDRFNVSFSGMDVADPQRHYTLISVVPAVFLVNNALLEGRNCPQTWEELLEPEWEQSVSLPVGDFDLFNSILLNILKRFGESGVARLGRSLQQSMHPSQMIKSGRKKEAAPAVTILPLFFTRMARMNPQMTMVWPKDGSIISPVFLLAQRSKKDQLKPIADFFASKHVGEILSHQGLFPSVHPDVDNHIDPEHHFTWLGWETIYTSDIPRMIQQAESIFNKAVEEVMV